MAFAWIAVGVICKEIDKGDATPSDALAATTLSLVSLIRATK